MRKHLKEPCPYPEGTPVLAYVDDEPGQSLGWDPRYKGRVLVLLNGIKISIALDNLRNADDATPPG